MILLLISLIVMLSAIVIYSGFHSKPKHYVRRISIRHVKLRNIHPQEQPIEPDADSEDIDSESEIEIDESEDYPEEY